MTHEPQSTASGVPAARSGGGDRRFPSVPLLRDSAQDLTTVRVGRCRLITEKALREWLERKTDATVETER
jgi:hypothetical protein